MKRLVLSSLLMMVALLVLATPPSRAQAGATATIVGTVTDPKGAVVPNGHGRGKERRDEY